MKKRDWRMFAFVTIFFGSVFGIVFQCTTPSMPNIAKFIFSGLFGVIIGYMGSKD